MINLKQLEVWLVTGSQHLYGPETLEQVAENSKTIAAAFDQKLPVKVVFKPVLPHRMQSRGCAWKRTQRRTALA